MRKETGGPAFPILADVRPDIDKDWCGMTLRDYFAAKAMATCPMRIPSDAARWCYQYADAMLEAREK